MNAHGLASAHVDFLSTKALAMPSVIVATFWCDFPFWVIAFLAALWNVSEKLYEAAAIDGATGGRPTHPCICQTLKRTGLLYIGDCKMGALETRATIVAGGDF